MTYPTAFSVYSATQVAYFKVLGWGDASLLYTANVTSTMLGSDYRSDWDVSGSNITSWEDSSIKVVVPAVTAGKYDVKITTSGAVASNLYPEYHVLTGDQVAVRFVVTNATTVSGENLYLSGNVDELGNWDTTKAIGPLNNLVEYVYPNWYVDVSVPANTALQYKFFKSNGGAPTWESGANNTVTTPATGTYTVSTPF